MNKSKLFIFIAFTLLVVVLAIVTMTSCSHPVKTKEPKIIEQQNAEAKFETRYESKDAEFLVTAAEINLEEILLGQLAAEKGTSAEVKNLGKLMIKAHELSLKDLNALASNRSIKIPSSATDRGQEAYGNLNAKEGKEFDRTYCYMIIALHREAITQFDKASTNSADTDIRKWTQEALPILRDHLDRALSCQTVSEK